ncbi:MAG: ABC transporter permease [Betaproteobacteria bacterium RIFCSPLOWO2_02_FULL_67_26]|nr:MAG: ABC transporter permease [Betaproteobacteria bacterium RIFCSPLOWO2_02_FULL_67_26]
MMGRLRLAARMLVRDWRAGELQLLAVALTVAVTSVTSVAFFGDRVNQALTRDAHQLLGADLLITSDHPLDPRFSGEARKQGLASASSTRFISMARRNEASQLAGVKAVSEGYPLRGRLRIAPALNVADAEADRVPGEGGVWVDERLALALGVGVGDAIELGASRLTVSAILTLEPDRGVTFFNLAPRLIMNVADLPRTGLIQVGSRVTYALLLAGERQAIDTYARWARASLGRGERVQGLDSARPEIRAGLDRAKQFLGLTALLAVVLAGVAIGLATRRYTERHLDNYAVMRCLGAGQRQLFALFAWEFVALGAIAAVLGCALGYGTQHLLSGGLSQFIAAQLPLPSWVPAAQGVLLAFVMLLGFALPPLTRLGRVPALRVLRRDAEGGGDWPLLSYGAGIAALSGLVLWQADDVKLGAHALAGFAGAGLAFAVVAYVALRLAARAGRFGGVAWRYGFANLRRRARSSTVQILALALGLTAILLLTVTRGDLLAAWRAKTPPDAPNRFILNIQPEQRAPLAQFFRDRGLPPVPILPMVRGRLAAINAVEVSAASYEEQRTKRLVEREFNLSYLDVLPAHNRITGGSWFSARDRERGALSIEDGIARTLGVKLGDQLTWVVGGQTFTAPVTSIRRLDWDSMQVNFFVIATPPLLERHPTSYITSFHLAGRHAQVMNQLAQAFPNMTVVDTSAILRQALAVMERVVEAVQVVFLFTLAAGLLVLYAALLATEDERVREAAIMRALGASRGQVASAQRAEFIAIGLLAGVLAAAGATGIGALIADRVLHLDYTPNAWIGLWGLGLGAACIAVNAMASVRAALSRPPIAALRAAE